MTRTQALFIGGAVAVHLAGYVWLGMIPKVYKQSTVAIALAEAKKKDDQEKEKQKPPPPPKKEPAKQAAKSKAAPPPKPEIQEAPPPPQTNTPPPPPGAGDAPGAMEGFADLGFAMGGGSGMAVPGGGGGGGAGGHGGGAGAAPIATTKQAVKQLATSDPGCTEELVKPKVDHQVQPAYTPEAQQAGVEGRVRLEVTVDATGHVTQVKVLSGLGFGLDESAIAAVKQYTFAPATKCGKSVPTTIKMGISFGLK